MYALISRDKIQLPAGTVVRMPGTWQDYCALRQSRGEGSLPRIRYRKGEILLMSPLPRHGREANIVADIVKMLLDREARNYEAFTPITMEIPEVGGIEPDYCFYIDHWQAAVGKDRMDWQVDPPPDLVLEVDITTVTAAEDYAPYGVPEVWLLKQSGLTVYGFQAGAYQPQAQSCYLPAVDLPALVAQVLQAAAERGTGTALREFRNTLLRP